MVMELVVMVQYREQCSLVHKNKLGGKNMNKYIKVAITENGMWYEEKTEFLVPKIIGLVSTTIKGILRYRKLLPLGHRLRHLQEEL
jgi:hypothetical protein